MKGTTYQEVLSLVETLGYQTGKLQKTSQIPTSKRSVAFVDGFDCYGRPSARKPTKL